MKQTIENTENTEFQTLKNTENTETLKNNDFWTMIQTMQSNETMNTNNETMNLKQWNNESRTIETMNQKQWNHEAQRITTQK